MKASMIRSTCALAGSIAGGCVGGPFDVRQFGQMREVMREGRSEARIRLADAVAAPHAYAVGALEELAGEITIIDGDVWVARKADGGVRVTGPAVAAGDRATLLTLVRVERWRGVAIPADLDQADLEAFIESKARERDIDTSAAFAFTIEGTFRRLDMHVANGFCPAANGASSGEFEPWRLSIVQPTDAAVVGFYARDAAGVMTHHGTAIHAHAMLHVGGSPVTGHADRLDVAAGAILRLPNDR